MSGRRALAVFAGISVSVALFAAAIFPAMTAAQSAPADEAAERVAKNKRYLEDAQAAYEKKQSATNQEEIDQLENQIRELEKLNIELYKMEPELEEKLYAAERMLNDKYANPDSADYIGNNPVEVVYADVLTRSIVVVVNQDKIASDGSNIPAETKVNDIQVVVKYGELVESSCTGGSRTGVCRPIWSGVSVAEQNTLSLNTASYKAQKGSIIGFVIAAHTAGSPYNGKIIVQPHNDASKRVGVVSGYCKAAIASEFGCDFAFVDTDTGISVDNKICLGLTSCTSTYTTVSKTPDSQQTIGTFVIKASANGNSLGEVTGNAGSAGTVKYNRAYTGSCIGGDSGSPIFFESGNNARIFGVATHCLNAGGQLQTFYWPWDYVNSRIGAIPPVPNT